MKNINLLDLEKIEELKLFLDEKKNFLRFSQNSGISLK